MGNRLDKQVSIIDYENPFTKKEEINDISKTLKIFFNKENTKPQNRKKASNSFSFKTDQKLNIVSNGKSIRNISILPESFISRSGSSSTCSENNRTDELLIKSTKNDIICENQMSLKKTADIIRNEYYYKLISNKRWLPYVKQKQYKTIFIFDWDDTLYCTTYLTPHIINKFKDLKPTDKKNLDHLDSVVYNLLSKCYALGQVYIITNASGGWVEYSSKKTYKKSLEIINKISIISSRSNNEKTYPGIAKLWKTNSFINTLSNSNLDQVVNLISIGDSNIELEASKALANTFRACVSKIIKFKESPNVVELIVQLEYINSQIYSIYSSPKNIIIGVENNE